MLCMVSVEAPLWVRRGTDLHNEVWQASQSHMPPPLTKKHNFFHMMRAHLQTILAKSADKQTPPERDIAHIGWEINDDISQYRPHTIKSLQVHYVRRLLEGQITLTLNTDI